MFKVGIIGVRPRQFATLQKLDFRFIEISSYDAKKMTPESVANFCRDLDRVVLLQTGAPKTAYVGAPKDRLQVLRNSSSISTVVRALNTIESEQAYAAELAIGGSEQFEHQGDDYSHSVLTGTTVEVETSEPAPVVERKPVPESIQLASEVPAGHVSQYALPKFEDEYVVSLPNSAGKQSYEILLAAVPGDIIRFARPEGLPLEKWQWRIRRARAYYLKHHNMLIEAHYFADFVDLKVMDKDMTVEQVSVTDTLNLAQPVETTATETVVEAKVNSDKREMRVDRPPYRPRLDQFEVLREAKEKGLFTTTTQGQPLSEDKGVIVSAIPTGMSTEEMEFDDLDGVEQTPAEQPAPVEEATPDPVVPVSKSERLGGLAHSHAGPYFSGLDSTVFPEGVAPPEKNIIHPLRDPNLHTPQVQALTPDVEKKVSTELENKFWRKVFFHFLNKGMDAAKAADEADTALTRYRNTL